MQTVVIDNEESCIVETYKVEILIFPGILPCNL